MGDTRRIRRLSYLIAFVVVAVVFALLLRGPHISNTLKRIILPELESASGQKVIAQKIYVNLFPLFVEAKGMKIFDERGERILFVKRVKAYIDLSGLLNREVVIRRLVIKEPEVNSDRAQVEEIVENIKVYLEQERETSLKVKVLSVEIQKGNVIHRDPHLKTSSVIHGLDGEMILGETQKVKVSADRVSISREGLQTITLGVTAGLRIRDGSVKITTLEVTSGPSKLSASGEYGGGRGTLKTKIGLVVASVKDLFRLKRSGEGDIRAEGDVTYAEGRVSVDLDVRGRFHLETLMEILDVEERIEGLVEVRGTLRGPVNALRGEGKAKLTKGNLYDVDIDSLSCTVSYADGIMKFADGSGNLYHGQARASAAITLPTVDYFTLAVDFEDVDSPPIFGLIEWDPGLQPGKVRGSLASSGSNFNPRGWFDYRSGSTGEDVLGRVRTATGRYSLEGDLLTLEDISLATGTSTVAAAGTVDIEKGLLRLNGEMKAEDVRDLSAPYYSSLQGRAAFSGSIGGTFEDPEIRGEVSLSNALIEGYPSGTVHADVRYTKHDLRMGKMVVTVGDESHVLSGGIRFPKAKELFELSDPLYDLTASFRNAHLGRFVQIFFPEFRGEGRFSGELKVSGTGESPVVRGKAGVTAGSVYGVAFDGAEFTLAYVGEKLTLSGIQARKGRSEISGDFFVDPDGRFSYSARTDNLSLADIMDTPVKGDVVMKARSAGRGSFDDPTITVDAKILRGVFRGKQIEGGVASALIERKSFTVQAKLLDEKILVSGKGSLEGDNPWSASVEMRSGRYDFLLDTFLKDVPEDLIVSASGVFSLKGDRRHVSGTSKIKHLLVSMYGYSFSNDDDINLELQDARLLLNRISLRSGNTVLKIDGGLVIGEEYDLVVEGSSALSPFKSLSSKIGLLKGDAEFVLSVSGRWDTPKINGGVTVANGAFGLKEYYHRLSSVNGYLYFDNDRVVLDRLSGKLGGGDVDISGILYLKRFSFRRFYVEAKMSNITASVSKDFTVNFGGALLYKGTPASQLISGDVTVNRARYRERVEWKSWLLKAKSVEKYKAEISNFEKAELNIKITGNETIAIDNNMARATASADMVLRGTVYRPVLFGRLETREGTVYFRNNEFRILHASADFADPNRMNPFLEIASETAVKGYNIKMNLDGQLDHFNMSLSSDPPLKEMDILALLTVGQTGGELKGLEGGVGASEATSFLTGKLQDVIEERLRSITGLDRFQIDPYVSKSTGTVEPRITVSKRLLGEKLFVTYTTSVGSVEEQILKLEYFLGRNISLVGIRDERGIIGGDVKFRFEFR